MAIVEGDFVKISYTGSADGKIFDSTDEGVAKESGMFNETALYGPMTVRAGSRHIIAGLDEDLIGKEVGYEGEIDVPPEKGFGPHDPEKVQSFPKSRFKEKPVKGMTIKVEDLGEGTVIDTIGGRVIADFNNPLAGKTLHYTYKIEEQVEDLKERVGGLIRLYSGRDMELDFSDGTLSIVLPPGINYDRRWVIWRSRVIHEAFEFIPEIQKIVLTETFTRPESAETGQKETTESSQE